MAHFEDGHMLSAADISSLDAREWGMAVVDLSSLSIHYGIQGDATVLQQSLLQLVGVGAVTATVVRTRDDGTMDVRLDGQVSGDLNVPIG